jgi:hypothetical protein
MIRKEFGEESISLTPKVTERVKWDKWRKNQEHASNFIWHQGDCSQRNRLCWLNNQHNTVTFYGNCVKMYKDFDPKFGDKSTGCCITTTRLLTFSFLNREFVTKKNMTVVPRPLYYFLFSGLKIKPPFWNNYGDRGWIAGGAEHIHRRRIPGCI